MDTNSPKSLGWRHPFQVDRNRSTYLSLPCFPRPRIHLSHSRTAIWKTRLLLSLPPGKVDDESDDDESSPLPWTSLKALPFDLPKKKDFPSTETPSKTLETSGELGGRGLGLASTSRFKLITKSWVFAPTTGWQQFCATFVFILCAIFPCNLWLAIWRIYPNLGSGCSIVFPNNSGS